MNNGMNRLCFADWNLEFLKTVLELCPKDQHVEVFKLTDGDGDTLLHKTARNPKYLKFILENCPQDQRLELLKAKNKGSWNILDTVEKIPQCMEVILELCPEYQSLEKKTHTDHNSGIVPNFLGMLKNSINTLLEYVPLTSCLEFMRSMSRELDTIAQLEMNSGNKLENILIVGQSQLPQLFSSTLFKNALCSIKTSNSDREEFVEHAPNVEPKGY
jgi:hypothetical protein